MFGYVTICKPELKVKEFYEFRAFYCGLCNVLRKKYGIKGQITLSYDMTFLVILLTSLYECATRKERHRCLIHPVGSRMTLINEVTEYGAAMNIALIWHHLRDDWQDERKIKGLAGSFLYAPSYQQVKKEYPRQCGVIKEKLERLAALEQETRLEDGVIEVDLDQISDCFGELMAELFVMRQDEWEEHLRGMGFYLGKFIYLMDAYEDLPKDEKSGSFNPLAGRKNRPDYKEECYQMLTCLMAECTRHFEYLPLVKDVDILRNILYNGVWMKYEKLERKHQEEIDL